MNSNLFKRGFISLIASQFFGAANDNILKQVLTFMIAAGGIWSDHLGAGGQGLVALCLTVPFIVLSGFAGQVADRFSKRSVMLAVKIAELPIALVAFAAMYFQNLWLGLLSMLLLGTQSTFFGPAKYGVIPELVDDGELSRANGALNMFTNIAIITGIIIAGPVSDLYHPRVHALTEEHTAAADGAATIDVQPHSGAEVAELLGLPADHQPLLWLPGAVMLAVAALGLLSILLMQKLKAAAPDLKYDRNPLGVYMVALRQMARGPLLVVALAWAFFYLIGSIALLILPDYAGLLGITYTRNIGLLGSLAVSIGIGSALCGLLSGHHIRLRFVVIGAIGMTVMFVLLGLVTPTYWNTLLLLIPAGISAGFYMVPLQALLQKLSPDDERGRFLGTANALSFTFISVGALIFMGASMVLGIPSNRIFLICAGLALFGTGAAIFRMRSILEHRPAQ